MAINPDPLDAFASDVTAALENYRVAVRRSGSEFAASMAEKKSSDLADVALTTLKSLVEDHKTRLAKQAESREGPVNSGSASIDGQRGTGNTEPELNRAERTIVDDLSRCISRKCAEYASHGVEEMQVGWIKRMDRHDRRACVL